MKRRDFVHRRSERSECGNYTWYIADGIVFVRTQNGQKATQIGGSSPHHIARILAKELGAFNHSYVFPGAFNARTAFLEAKKPRR